MDIIYLWSEFCVFFHSILPHISGYGDRGGSSADGNYNYGGKFMVVLPRPNSILKITVLKRYCNNLTVKVTVQSQRYLLVQFI